MKGNLLGRVLGFPTANIDVDSHYKLIPSAGIYAVTVKHAGKRYNGMLYIGTRPTVEGAGPSIEVNIFDFNKDIYGEEINVYFEKLLRLDSKFGLLGGIF